MTILYYYRAHGVKLRALERPKPKKVPGKKKKNPEKLQPKFTIDYSALAEQANAEILRISQLLEQQAETERQIWRQRVDTLEKQARELQAALKEELRLDEERALLASALQAINSEIERAILAIIETKNRQERQEKELQALVELDEIASVSELM